MYNSQDWFRTQLNLYQKTNCQYSIDQYAMFLTSDGDMLVDVLTPKHDV